MATRLTLAAPRDYVLRRDVCSYGYFLLAPNLWNPRAQTLTRPLDLEGGVATFVISQSPGRGGAVQAHADRALTKAEQAQARGQLGRMLSFDDRGVKQFHAVDPRFRASGRGRLFRSPTFFEDVIKTVTSCNVTWPSTIRMNELLCAVINPAFPRATQLARRRPATLRSRCGVGYRDARIVELAKLFARGAVDPAWFESPATPDDAIHDALLELPGIGPYAAANIMQLLGRYDRLPVDTESVRHGRSVLGMTGTSKHIERAIHAHYEPFGPHKFRSYWFEVWDYYEAKRGPAWTWDPATTGKSFTAALLAERPAPPTAPSATTRRGPGRGRA